MTDEWKCTVMVNPTDRGGAPGPGDGAVAPYVGFARDAVRKDFPVMQKNLSAWDWNSNDADVRPSQTFSAGGSHAHLLIVLGTPCAE